MYDTIQIQVFIQRGETLQQSPMQRQMSPAGPTQPHAIHQPPITMSPHMRQPLPMHLPMRPQFQMPTGPAMHPQNFSPAHNMDAQQFPMPDTVFGPTTAPCMPGVGTFAQPMQGQPFPSPDTAFGSATAPVMPGVGAGATPGGSKGDQSTGSEGKETTTHALRTVSEILAARKCKDPIPEGVETGPIRDWDELVDLNRTNSRNRHTGGGAHGLLSKPNTRSATTSSGQVNRLVCDHEPTGSGSKKGTGCKGSCSTTVCRSCRSWQHGGMTK